MASVLLLDLLGDAARIGGLLSEPFRVVIAAHSVEPRSAYARPSSGETLSAWCGRIVGLKVLALVVLSSDSAADLHHSLEIVDRGQGLAAIGFACPVLACVGDREAVAAGLDA